jgi:hypothetical protein
MQPFHTTFLPYLGKRFITLIEAREGGFYVVRAVYVRLNDF